MRNDNILFTILAIIGAVVVLLFVLKVAIKLIGLVVLLGLAVAAYFLFEKLVGKGR